MKNSSGYQPCIQASTSQIETEWLLVKLLDPTISLQLLETLSLVKILGSLVLTINFQINRLAAASCSVSENLIKQLGTKAEPAKLGEDVQFIQPGGSAAMFQRPCEGDDRAAYQLAAFLCGQNKAQPFFADEPLNGSLQPGAFQEKVMFLQLLLQEFAKGDGINYRRFLDVHNVSISGCRDRSD